MAPRVLISVERGLSAAPLIAQAQEEFGPGMDIFLGHVHTRDALTPEEERELSALFQEAYAARHAGLAVRVVTVEADDLQEGITALDRAIGADVVAVRDGTAYTDDLELCFVEQRVPAGVSGDIRLRRSDRSHTWDQAAATALASIIARAFRTL
ncbi:MAG: hypothetical protein WD208_11560 [Dehalococcoidia bacterium]